MKPSTYWKILLGAAVAVSVAGNTGHVLLSNTEPRWAAAAWAAVPPLFLFAVTHGLTVSAGAGVRTWAYRCGVAGAIGIAAGAFWASYVALRDLSVMLGCPPAVAVVMPLVVDAAIAVASTLALATTPAMETATDKAATVPDVEVATPATATAAPAASPAAADRVPATDAATAKPATVATSPKPAARVKPATSRKPAATRKPTAPRSPGARAGAGAAAVAGPDAEAFMGLAARLVAEGRVRARVDVVAAALAGIASGASQRSVAAATGLHRTVVAKVAERVTETEEERVAA